MEPPPAKAGGEGEILARITFGFIFIPMGAPQGRRHFPRPPVIPAQAGIQTPVYHRVQRPRGTHPAKERHCHENSFRNCSLSLEGESKSLPKGPGLPVSLTTYYGTLPRSEGRLQILPVGPLPESGLEDFQDGNTQSCSYSNPVNPDSDNYFVIVLPGALG